MNNPSGTLCFVNSAFQVLSRSDTLMNACTKDRYVPWIEKVFNLLFHARTRSPHASRLRDELVRDLDARFGTRSFHEQGDPQEFLFQFLESCLRPSVTSGENRFPVYRVHESVSKEFPEAFQLGLSLLLTLVHETTTTLTCGHCAEAYPRSVPMTICTLHPEESSYTLEDLWTRFLQTQSVEDWTCDKCKVKAKSDSSIKIARYADLLILCVSRWNTNGTKHKKSISANVQLGPYRLKGVIAHTGSGTDAGHYVACAHGPNPGIIDDDRAFPWDQGPDIAYGLARCPPGLDLYVAVYER